MLKITTTNGKKMSIANDHEVGYFRCDECEKSVIRYWNDKKRIFSEVYVSAEEATALALKGVPHFSDLDDEIDGLDPIEEHNCQECTNKISTLTEFFPSPPGEDDYEGAYGTPFKRH